MSLLTKKYNLPSAVCTSAIWMWKKTKRQRLNFDRFGLLPPTSGRREMPCRCRQRCSAERGRWGSEGCRAYKAVIQWRQRMTLECHDHRLFSLSEDGGTRFRRSGPHMLDRCPLAPPRNSFGVDAKRLAQQRARSLRSLYCCTDSVRGRSTASANLSHKASFYFKERLASLNRGMKHLRENRPSCQDQSEAVSIRHHP